MRKVGSSAATTVGSARAVKFVDLLREGVVSKEEYERLVEPVKARKRKAERMAEQGQQPPPRVRHGPPRPTGMCVRGGALTISKSAILSSFS